MRYAVRAAALLAASLLVIAGCGPAETPSVIYVTTSPGGTAAATGSPGAASASAATPSNAGTLPPLPTPTPPPVRHEYLLYESGSPITNGFRPEVWVVKANGTGNHKIADGPDEPQLSPPTHQIAASWSHDGSVVHFVKYTTGTPYCLPQITNIPIDGGAAVPVNASLTNQDDNFIWSPDDTRIAFRHWVGQPNCVMNSVDNRTNLVIMNADGTNKHTVATTVSYDITAWTSDGTGLIGHSKTVITQAVRVNPTTGIATNIGPLSGSYTPAVSPNGTGVAFISGGKLHVVNANGSGAINLGVTGSTDYGPVWSPDGTSIAFQRTTSGTVKIVVVKLPGPTATMLYNAGASYLNGIPCWSPDSQRVAMAVHSGPVVVAKADGTSATPLPGLSDIRMWSWQP